MAIRNYKKEYKKFQSSAKSKKDRAGRNRARRRLMALGAVSKGDGKDIDHRDKNPRNNARSNLRISEVNYSKYFGDLPLPYKALMFPLSISSDIVGDLSVDKVPAVRESALRTLLAEKQVAVARSAFMPKINAQVGSSSPMDPDENISAQAGILISYQFSDGGAREANLSRAKNDFERAKRSLEFTFENTGSVLEALQEQVSNIKEIIALAEQKLPILTDRLRVAETQIQTGQADISKVFDLKLQINELKSRIRRGQADLLRTQFELASALGLLSN